MMPDMPPEMNNQMATTEIQCTAVDESPSDDKHPPVDVGSGLLPLRSLQETAQDQDMEQEQEKYMEQDESDGTNSQPEDSSDKLKMLEDRLTRLEEITIPGRPLRSDVNSESVFSYDENRPVEHTVKFFPMSTFFGYNQIPRYYSSKSRPSQRELHFAPPGTYACQEDSQQFIRVAYEPILPAMSARGSNPLPPLDGCHLDPAHIADILTFSVVSSHIASFFAEELEAKIQDFSVGGIDGHAVVCFGKPFRPVLHHLDSMRKQLQELEQAFGHAPISANSPGFDSCYPDANGERGSPVSNTDAEPDSVFNNKERLIHFKTFVEFVNKYFADQIQLYQNLRARKLETVAFENLWMLFHHQDTIYCPVREARKATQADIEDVDEFYPPVIRHLPQAYRVIGTEGGMPIESWQPTVGYSSFADSKTMIQSNRSADLETASDGTRGLASRVRRSYNDLHVRCYFIDFDGTAYGRVPEIFVFKRYEGEMEIRTLQVYPIDYATGNNLADRGYKFMDATTVSHRQYEGLTVGTSREEINSPVIVDAKMAFEVGPSMGSSQIQAPDFAIEPRYSRYRTTNVIRLIGCARNIYKNTSCAYPRCQRDGCTEDIFLNSVRSVRRRAEADLKVLLGEQELYKERHAGFKEKLNTADLVRLLPGAAPAYALRNRKWVLLDLNLLKPIKQNYEWKNLVLPKGHRKMVQAMVETHTSQVGEDSGTKTVGMDIVQGKGRGCIILLHGVPGVGKTSTAECVAAHTNKPLYPITCGDIGYRPEDLERNMENHFRLAHRWGCVLLLDEADVFLAKRDQRDVQRNGLVSVFLRILEYYSGILFLTTNRVGAIDDAFRSRLHLTLYYPKLNKEQTAKIFKRNFKRIEDINKDREKHRLLPFEYQKSERKAVIKWAQETWKKLRWNGRQIRNTFQTVLALAEFDARGTDGREPTNPVVTKGHFRIVASASVQFNEYLKQTHGFDEDRIAKRDFIRAENFSVELEESSSETESSSSEDSDLSYESETDGDSEESENDSDDDKKRKKGGKLKEKEKKDKKGKTGRSGAKTASKKVKKNKGDGDGKKKGGKKTKEKEKKKKNQEGEGGEEDDSESDSDDSE